ncbi:MAG TPA: sigma-70 family RNA polymerase sigma factor [Clostridia bacterium]|nr:sigma-70 family RNA polymerase sigma factor [Clostridia bacterium]
MHESEIIAYFAEHYEEYLKLAFMVTRDFYGAQDVLQNVALSLCRQHGDMEDIKNPGGFLSVCVRQAAISYIRKTARALPVDPTILNGRRADDTVAQSYVEWTIVLDKHLASYSQNLRQAFVAFYLDGYSLEQSATLAKMSPNALSQQFKRMRTRLARQSPILHTLMTLLSLL